MCHTQRGPYCPYSLYRTFAGAARAHSFKVTRWPAVQFPKPVHMLRLELRDRCKRLRNASSCTYVEPQPSTVPLATTRSLANGAVDPASTEATSKRVAPYLTIAQLYRRSTFCLQVSSRSLVCTAAAEVRSYSPTHTPERVFTA
eukprot:266118-Prymnesium_polylepis.2